MPIPVPTGYEVTIAKDVQPKWSAAEAAELVFAGLVKAQQLYRDDAPTWALVEPRILSISAMRLRDVPEDAYGGPWNGDSEHQDPNEVVWVVDAEGTFYKAEPGRTLWGTQGSWIFDDHGREIVSGFHLVTPSATPGQP